MGVFVHLLFCFGGFVLVGLFLFCLFVLSYFFKFGLIVLNRKNMNFEE